MEVAVEVVGQLTKQGPLKLLLFFSTPTLLRVAHGDQAKIYCKNWGMVPLTVLFHCSPLPTPAPTPTSSQPRYSIVWPKYNHPQSASVN